MHIDALHPDTPQRPSRRLKDRDVLLREPQPTDIDEKLMAFRRRTAGPPRSREKQERDRERFQQPQQLPSSSRPDRSPGLLPAPASLKPSPSSPRRINPPHVSTTCTADADHEEFSRRLKISSTSTPRLSQSHAKLPGSSKLYNPDTDPIPMRRTTEPESISHTLNVPRPPGNNSAAHQRDDRGGTQRQLFDYRKDDPVKFSVFSRPLQPPQSRPPPTPKSSGDYVSASSTSSYTPSIASSITLSSTTDSSASSALFDNQGQAHERSSSNSMQLKYLYREMTDLENRIKQEDSQDEAEDPLEARVLIRGREAENLEPEKEKWLRRIAEHKKLANITHELLAIALAPSVPASLRQIPAKYNIVVRLWTFAFHRLLEALRRASFSSIVALELLQEFIYYAYTFYTVLLENYLFNDLRNGWLEALGDLARYRMVVAAMITGGVGGGGSTTLTSNAILEAGISATADFPESTESLPPPTSASAAAAAPVAPSSDTGANKGRIDASPSPSVGVAAARLLEVEPEKELWRAIARGWYATGLTDQPGTGKLHHHLGLLSREVEGEELRGIYHFVKSMTALHPFSTARESVLPLWSSSAQARRLLPDARVSDLFVLLHGMLFTNIELDDFQPVLARFIERLELDGATEREWIMMAVVNIGAVFEYGRPGGVLRRASGIAAREGDGQHQNSAKVVAKRVTSAKNPVSSTTDKMDIDDEQTQGDIEMKQTLRTSSQQSSNLYFHQGELPTPFSLALQLTFSMLSYVLRHPHLKSSAYTCPDINPYLTVILTFLVTMLKHPAALQVLERPAPWEELAAFFSKIPKKYMSRQGLLNSTSQPQPSQSTIAERAKWTMLTNGCAPPLPEDWCMRGTEWGRRLFERGYWKFEHELRTEIDALAKSDHVVITDGRIEDDDGADVEQNSPKHVNAQLRQTQAKSTMSQVERRWTRVLRCAVGIADVVEGFAWTTGTKTWTVEGRLMEKVSAWKEEDRLAKADEERRRMGWRRTDDFMEVDEEAIVESEESEDDENDSEEVKDLKARRRYLLNLLQSTRHDEASLVTNGSRSRSAPRRVTSRPSLRVVPGYTVLVIDTNILLSSLSIFASLVESLRWTIVVPLPVVMELDGLATNSSPLGEAALNAIAYITSHIRTHGLALKVQTSKGNYLTTLTVRTEQLQFVDTAGTIDMDRNVDDLILRTAIWQDEHWVDRSTLHGQKTVEDTVDAVKVVLLSLDRNLRLKARSRQLPAIGEKDLALILADGK